MATTIYNNKYPIPEGFHDILHDFIKEIIRAQPNDIFDFGIQYFSKLELGQEPNKQKANSMVYPSGETSTINTKSNFYENNTQIQINQIVENPIREKISDENTPIGTSANVEPNNYRPPSRLTTMSVNSTIKNDAREFIGNVLSESKIKNNVTKDKSENNENDEINNQNENVEKKSENNENNENIQSENNENVEKVQSENNENIQSENVENNENVQSENNENIENVQSENVQSENNENTNENKNENEENNYEDDNIDQNYNIEENNNDINESINSKNKSNSYSINSTQKNDAKEFVEEVLSESKKSFH